MGLTLESVTPDLMQAPIITFQFPDYAGVNGTFPGFVPALYKSPFKQIPHARVDAVLESCVAALETGEAFEVPYEASRILENFNAATRRALAEDSSEIPAKRTLH